MLDQFLKVAHQHQVKQAESEEFVSLLKQLPVEELRQIHETGEIKLACDGDSSSSGLNRWLDHFKGSPLLPQAIALEEEDLKQQAASKQLSAVEDQSRQESFRKSDQLRLQKRLLELELAKHQAQVAAVSEAPVPEEVSPATKMAGTHPEQMVHLADSWGRELARADFEKSAHAHTIEEQAVALMKEANVLALLAPLTPVKVASLGDQLLQFATKNPSRMGTIAGTVLGGIGGAMAGGEDHRLSGALMGAGTGALVGAHAGPAIRGISRNMKGGQGFGDAVKTFGKERYSTPYQAARAFTKDPGNAANHASLVGALEGTRPHLDEKDLPHLDAALQGMKALGGFSQPKTAEAEKAAFMAPLLGALGSAGLRAGVGAAAKSAVGNVAKAGLGQTLKNWATQPGNAMRAVGGGLNAASNFAQARQSGQGLGSSLLQGAAGGATALAGG